MRAVETHPKPTRSGSQTSVQIKDTRVAGPVSVPSAPLAASGLNRRTGHLDPGSHSTPVSQCPTPVVPRGSLTPCAGRPRLAVPSFNPGLRVRSQKENESTSHQNLEICEGQKSTAVAVRRPTDAFPSVEQLQAMCSKSQSMSPGKVDALLGDLNDMERCAAQLKNMILEARRY